VKCSCHFRICEFVRKVTNKYEIVGASIIRVLKKQSNERPTVMDPKMRASSWAIWCVSLSTFHGLQANLNIESPSKKVNNTTLIFFSGTHKAIKESKYLDQNYNYRSKKISVPFCLPFTGKMWCWHLQPKIKAFYFSLQIILAARPRSNEIEEFYIQ
jgi:hypothetical protein